MMYGAGDRRSHVRFDIVGHVWGTFETVVGTNVVNISMGGALVESPLPLPASSAHEISLTRGEVQATVRVRVRHSRPTGDGGAYLVGLEFAPVPASVRALIEQFVTDACD